MINDFEHLAALEREITHLQTLLAAHDSGHIHTAIRVLEDRCREIYLQLNLEFMS